MFEVIISKKVENFLDTQNKKFVAKFFKLSIQIAKKPFEAYKSIDIKILKGEEKYHFRLKMNKIRFIYKGEF